MTYLTSMYAALDAPNPDRFLVLSQLADLHDEMGADYDPEAAEVLRWAARDGRWPWCDFIQKSSHWSSTQGTADSCAIPNRLNAECKQPYSNTSAAFIDLIRAYKQLTPAERAEVLGVVNA